MPGKDIFDKAASFEEALRKFEEALKQSQAAGQPSQTLGWPGATPASPGRPGQVRTEPAENGTGRPSSGRPASGPGSSPAGYGRSGPGAPRPGQVLSPFDPAFWRELAEGQASPEPADQEGKDDFGSEPASPEGQSGGVWRQPDSAGAADVSNREGMPVEGMPVEGMSVEGQNGLGESVEAGEGGTSRPGPGSLVAAMTEPAGVSSLGGKGLASGTSWWDEPSAGALPPGFAHLDRFRSPLVQGVIWAEVLGRPVSKRHGRGRRGF